MSPLVTAPAGGPERLPDGRGWRITRLPDSAENAELFVRSDGREYVRARADETPDVIIAFARHGGAGIALVARERSGTAKRAAKRARKAQRELTKRGLA